MNEPNILRYTRIETMPDGGSKFADDSASLTVRPVAVGMAPMATGELPSAQTVFVRSGEFDSTPHPAPARQWVVMIRGTIEVTTTAGEKRVFGPGDLLLVSDTEGLGHSTLALGSSPFEALFIPAPADV
ncbi:hypothetical protein ACIP5Y_37100 [Nocardia sp. NPDC088792]|uniref:hypothetical protein n=1 Tax=Nocardia sp. NPDC088792 TaxID=3364332 RepID=UPI0038007CF2